MKKSLFSSILAAMLLVGIPAFAAPIVWTASNDYDNNNESYLLRIDTGNSYSTSTFRVTCYYIECHDPLLSMGISPDSSKIVVGSLVHHPIFFDIFDQSFQTMGGNFVSQGDIVFSPDSTHAFTLSPNSSSGYLSDFVFNRSTNEGAKPFLPYYQGSLSLSHDISHGAFPNGNSTLYVNGGGQLQLVKYSPELYQPLYHFDLVADVATTTTGENIAFSANGSKLYVSEHAGNTVTVMNATTLLNTNSIGVGAAPGKLGIPNGVNKLYVLNTGAGTVSVISTATELVTNTITIGADKDLEDIAFSHDGTRAYVLSGHYTTTGESELVVIDTATDAVLTAVALPGVFYTHNIVVEEKEYTASGTQVTVQPAADVQTIFSNVSASGNTTATVTTTPPQLPSGFADAGGNYYDITTTATHTGTTTVCLHYPTWVSNESQIALLHYESPTGWVDRTTSLDTSQNVVCGEVSSLSPFTAAYSYPLSVGIDIVPKKTPNKIVLHSKNGVPVAIFGSATFDVTSINLETLRFAGAATKHEGNGSVMVKYKDVNNDGRTDATVRFITDQLQLTPSSTAATLSGKLVNGRNLTGSDSVQVFGCQEDDSECEED